MRWVERDQWQPDPEALVLFLAAKKARRVYEDYKRARALEGIAISCGPRGAYRQPWTPASERRRDLVTRY